MLCCLTCCEMPVSPHLATQVDSGATAGGLFVQSVSRSDEVTDISDVDAHLRQINNILRDNHNIYIHIHTNHLILCACVYNMCTSRFPLSSSLQCRASSMSVHPGGSTLHTVRCLRSSLFAMSCTRHTHTHINIYAHLYIQYVLAKYRLIVPLINKTISRKLPSLSRERQWLPLVWWSTASWEENWAQPERRPGGERHAPVAGLPVPCPSPQHCPNYAQSDPNKKEIHFVFLCRMMICPARDVWLHTNTENMNMSCQTRTHQDVNSNSRTLTFGYLEFLGQPSMATMILWPASAAAWRVSMRMRGTRRSAGVKRWRVDFTKQKRKVYKNRNGEEEMFKCWWWGHL